MQKSIRNGEQLNFTLVFSCKYYFSYNEVRDVYWE